MSSAATVMAGYLEKEGGKALRVFQRRYFVLRGRTLFWFRNRKDMEPSGRLLVPSCAIEPLPQGQQYTVFSVVAPHKRYYLRCSNVEEKHAWLDALCGVAGGEAQKARRRKRVSDHSNRKPSPARRARSFSDTAMAPGLEKYAPQRSGGGGAVVDGSGGDGASILGPLCADEEIDSDSELSFGGTSADDLSASAAIAHLRAVAAGGTGGQSHAGGSGSGSGSSVASRSHTSSGEGEAATAPPFFSFPKVLHSPLETADAPPASTPPRPAPQPFTSPPPSYPAPPPPSAAAMLQLAASLPPGRNPEMRGPDS